MSTPVPPTDRLPGRSLARRYFEELFNAGDITVAAQILHPDISFLGPITPDGIHGLEAFEQFARAWYAGFPDRHFEVLDEWTAQSAIATRFHITGTHLGEFLGRPPTGNAIAVTAMNVMRIRGGKIHAVQAFFDPRDLLHPLGLSTAPR